MQVIAVILLMIAIESHCLDVKSFRPYFPLHHRLSLWHFSSKTILRSNNIFHRFFFALCRSLQRKCVKTTSKKDCNKITNKNPQILRIYQDKLSEDIHEPYQKQGVMQDSNMRAH